MACETVGFPPGIEHKLDFSILFFYLIHCLFLFYKNPLEDEMDALYLLAIHLEQVSYTNRMDCLIVYILFLTVNFFYVMRIIKSCVYH